MKLIAISFLIFLGTLMIIACSDEEALLDEVIDLKADISALDADGASTTTLYAYIPIDAKPDKRLVTFSTLKGAFEDSVAGTQAKKISVKAETRTDDHWIARAKYMAGHDTGSVDVFASIEGFTDKVTLTMKPVPATSIALSADAFSVPVNFLGEISLVATLRSSTGTKVSKGQQVKFTDTYEDGTAVGGEYRNLQLSSDENSQVKATYSPGEADPGQFIYLTVHLLDEHGAETGITDSTKIYLRTE